MAEKTVTQNGLIYTLSEDGTYYTVEIPSELGEDVSIENSINGTPVVYNDLDGDNYENGISVELVGSSSEEDSEFSSSSEIADNDDYEVLSFIDQNNVKYAVVTHLPTSDTFAAAINTYNTAEDIVIDSVVSNYTVKMIDGGAFGFCTKLTSINIPDSVTRIGGYAFRDCTSLKNITIPDSVAAVGEYTFYNCTSLTSITIPDGVTSIGDYAFQYCSALTSVTIGNGVTSIGNYAFRECNALTSITIGNGVTTIGYRAFEDCSALTSITIPDSVTSIGDSTFEFCSALTSVTIGDSVTSIGRWAFSGCKALKTVILGKGLKTLFGTSIGNGSFNGCTALTTVINKSNNLVTPNNTYPFSGCSNLTKVYYTSTTAGYIDGGTWCGKTLEYLNWNGEDSLMLNAEITSTINLPTDAQGKTRMRSKKMKTN